LIDQRGYEGNSYSNRAFVFVFVFSYFNYHIPFCSIDSSFIFLSKVKLLAGSDEESQRRWVVVLEEVQAQATLG